MPGTAATSRRAGLRRRVEASPHADQLVADNDRAQGTCSYYPADAGGCRAPRSCYDCLNTVLEKEPGGCVINEIGRCVSAPENYDPTLDFRVVSDVPLGGEVTNSSSPGTNASSRLSEATQPLTPGSYQLQFPASNTTYCEDEDRLFNEDSLADGGFMFGTGGCVFVAVCEAPGWAYIVGGSDCSGAIAAVGPGENEPRDEGDSTQGYLVFWCVAIAILLTLVATLAMVITLHHHHSKRRIEELQRRRTIAVGEPIATAVNSRTPKASKHGVQLLNLFGWEAMRVDLIEKERQDIQERQCAQSCQASENSLPGGSPSTNYLQFVGAQPSAPVMSPIVSSAPRLTDC